MADCITMALLFLVTMYGGFSWANNDRLYSTSILGSSILDGDEGEKRRTQQYRGKDRIIVV